MKIGACKNVANDVCLELKNDTYIAHHIYDGFDVFFSLFAVYTYVVMAYICASVYTISSFYSSDLHIVHNVR